MKRCKVYYSLLAICYLEVNFAGWQNVLILNCGNNGAFVPNKCYDAGVVVDNLLVIQLCYTFSKS